MFVPALGASRPINLEGKSKIDGVELGLTLRPFVDFSVRAAYAHTDGEDPNGDALVRRPRHVGSVNFNYAFLEGRANANLGVVYNGRQKDNRFDAATFARTPISLKNGTLVEEICRKLGVSEATFYRWRSSSPAWASSRSGG